MAAEVKIKTRCTHCRTKYLVPSEALGQAARCARCGRSFRVAHYQPQASPPTEDDILRWLSEGMEEYGFASQSRYMDQMPITQSAIREEASQV